MRLRPVRTAHRPFDMSTLPLDVLSEAANVARGLAIDAVHKCSSGHLGLPLGAAEIGAALFGQALSYNPLTPSGSTATGSSSRLVTAACSSTRGCICRVTTCLWTRLRTSASCTARPRSPEFGETVGVEATTGPLGQGVGNAVGYAVSAKMAAARFNTAEHAIFDHHIVALAGDGCLQEGVAYEAIAFAGHFQLDNLILIYDSNDVTLDAMAIKTQSGDTAARFVALGWDAVTVDGHDIPAFLRVYEAAKANNNGRPKIIIAKTEIARGIPEVAGTAGGHGEGGAKFSEAARKGLGLPAEHFFVSDKVKQHFAAHKQSLVAKYDAWQKTFAAWSKANPEKAQLLADGIAKKLPENLVDLIPEFPADAKIATRQAGADVMQPLAKGLPLLITGSADLYGSTKNYIKGGKDFEPQSNTSDGRNIWFGIREHGMGAIMNGIAYDGIFRTSGATFAVFADYLRPSIRLAALAHLPTIYIFTHDSIGVGEDGPTHQPVETCSGLRVIPNLDVIRPGDPEETAGAFAAALQRTDGPTVLLLTRQNIASQASIPAKTRREGAARGGYIAKKETGKLETILIGTGSELQHVMKAPTSSVRHPRRVAAVLRAV